MMIFDTRKEEGTAIDGLQSPRYVADTGIPGYRERAAWSMARTPKGVKVVSYGRKFRNELCARATGRWFGVMLMVAWCVIGGQPPSALAQGAQRLEEVVVVARKRTEMLQDTPVAVSAFSADQLREAQITNIADLAQHVPGLTNKDGDKNSGLTIRGVGTRTSTSAVDPGVAVYVDGVFIPRSDTQLVDVVDMESIQVLRGPQGTLFGKNSAGGAVLLISRKPAEEFTAQVEVGLGDYDRQNLGIRIEGPLIDNTLFGALTYDTRNEDGYMKDFYTGIDYSNRDRQAVVGQLRWQPNEDLTVDFLALWGKVEENSHAATCINVNPTAIAQGLRSTTPGTYAEFCAQSENLVNQEKVAMDSSGLEWNVTNQLASLTLDWDLGALTLKSVTGYLAQDDLKREPDVEATPFFTVGNFGETTRQMEGSGIEASDEKRLFVSQEFTLFGSLFDDKLEYTLGIYGSDESIDNQVSGQTLGPGGWLGFPVPNSTDVITLAPSIIGFQNGSLTDYTSTSAATFGQFTYNYSDMWQFTLGARWTWEEKTIDQDNYLTTATSMGVITREQMNALHDFLLPITVNPAAARLQDDDSWTEFTPSATVTMFAPDSWTDGFVNSAMLYLTYSEGFKAGGFTAFGPTRAESFDPESVENTEFGFKTEMWDQRLRVNGAIYSMDYSDMQLSVARQLSELETRIAISNAGSAEIQGVELEVVMLPLDGLLINLTGSYIDASYKEFFDEFIDSSGTVQISDRSDEPFANLPEQTYSWAVQYDWHTDWALFTPRISGYYKDKVYIGLDTDSFAFEEEATLDDYVIWNARLAVQPHQVEGLEVALFAQNLTDKFYYGTGVIEVARVGGKSLTRGKPRAYGIDVYYRW